MMCYNLDYAGQLISKEGIFEIIVPMLDLQRRTQVKILLNILNSLYTLFTKEKL